MSVVVLLIAGAVLAPERAQAQDSQWTTNLSVSYDACGGSRTTPVPLDQLAQDPGRWEGECVSVEGYWTRAALYSNQDDARKDRDNWIEDFHDRRVGLYGKRVIHAADPGQANFSRATGVVWTCEDLRSQFNLMQGYCVYGEGAVLITSSIQVLEGSNGLEIFEMPVVKVESPPD